jgi:hypothetical protein
MQRLLHFLKHYRAFHYRLKRIVVMKIQLNVAEIRFYHDSSCDAGDGIHPIPGDFARLSVIDPSAHSCCHDKNQ